MTVIVTHGATDLSGNPLVDFASVFATAADFDLSHASVVSQRPGNGSTAVPVTNSIVLFANKALNAATVKGALHVTQNGELVTGGTITVSDNDQTIQFVPPQSWPYGALVQVFLDTTAQDLEGNAVNAYQGSFNTVGDPTTTAPMVVNTSPGVNVPNMPLNTVIDVGYSEPLDPNTVNSSDVLLNGPGGQVALMVTLDTTGTVIHAVPDTTLLANSGYCFYVQSGVLGTNGLAAQTLGYCFTTGSSSETGTTVVSVSPANQLPNVPVNANIRVRFSGPIDPLTVNGSTIQVSGGNQTAVPSAISFSENNQVVQITPHDPLPASTVMTLTLAGVTDLAGNVIAGQSTQFTTGLAPQTYTTYVINS